MRMAHIRNLIFLCMPLCFLVCGCATFKNHRLPVIEDLPARTGGNEPLKAGYSFTSAYVGSLGRIEDQLNIGGIVYNVGDIDYEKEFVEVMKESGYFKSFERGRREGEPYIEVDLTRNLDYIWPLCLIGGLTIGVIPSCWHTLTFWVKAIGTSAAGPWRRYVLEDATTKFFWLPFTFVAPFLWHETIGAEVRKNMYRNLILQMERDGLLSPPKAVQKPVSLRTESN